MDTLNNMVTGSMLRDEAMTRHTSYGIGGPTKAYITPVSYTHLTLPTNREV